MSVSLSVGKARVHPRGTSGEVPFFDTDAARRSGSPLAIEAGPYGQRMRYAYLDAFGVRLAHLLLFAIDFARHERDEIVHGLADQRERVIQGQNAL